MDYIPALKVLLPICRIQISTLYIIINKVCAITD